MFQLNKIQKYLLVGGSINGLSLVIYIFLTNFIFKFDPIITVIILSPTIMIVHFFFQFYYVFSKKFFQLKILIKYFFNYFFFYFMNIGLLFFFINYLSFNHNYAQILIVIFLTIFNYIISDKIIFIK